MHFTPRQSRIIGTVFQSLLALFIVAIAAIAAAYMWTYYERDPRTRDAHVRADVVNVTTDVSGLLTEVNVHGNVFVHRGDVLFRVDPQRFQIAEQKARASLESAEAQRVYAGQQAARNRALRGAVSEQSVEQSDQALRGAQAAVDEARAALASARLDLERATVRAPFDGIVTNATLHPGRFVSAGTGMLALVNVASLRVEGYFQETRISRIHVGDRARIWLMGEGAPLDGHVISVVGAIQDSDTAAGAGALVPSINPNFAWVRLAQRVPVWIAFDDVQTHIDARLISGRTASVAILKSGDAQAKPGAQPNAPGGTAPERMPAGASGASAAAVVNTSGALAASGASGMPGASIASRATAASGASGMPGTSTASGALAASGVSGMSGTSTASGASSRSGPSTASTASATRGQP
ncbi:efflux RND transporter periplasmic adaptor subunit [Burkholderia sp. 22PA0106]|uniref:efflux RND transporter periplasmic adaptor subunit n=1 Tax=Burkholderia sp. 22PA0106 TaxID=3237371 RepID=UPI0039C03475